MSERLKLSGRQNNLNILRFAAALLVIYSHAFVLTGNGSDGISRLTRGQTTGGQIAVLLFFFYGGLLIMKSIENKKDGKEFFRARLLRLFPALWIVVLCSAFALGPLLTTLPLSEYLKSGGTWKYLLNGLLLPVHTLPGVFESNPAMSTVNGALWTLPVEFFCYIMCYVFYKTGLSAGRKPLILLPVVITVAIAAWILLKKYVVLQNAILPVLFFYIGMVCCVYRDHIPLNGYVAFSCCALLVLATLCNIFIFAVCVLYPYILLYLGFGTRKKLHGFGRRLELSYAVYLTGFPIQQTLVHFNVGMQPMVNFAFAAVIAILIAIPLTLADQKISAWLGKK